MTKEYIIELKEKYENLHKEWSEAQQRACKLSGDSRKAYNDLLNALIELFRNDSKYSCRHCGKKMEIRSISYPIDDVFYYLSCEGCKRQEPEFHLAIDAYLDWFNKCNNEESK